MSFELILKCCDRLEHVAIILGAVKATPEVAHTCRAAAAPVARVVRYHAVRVVTLVRR